MTNTKFKEYDDLLISFEDNLGEFLKELDLSEGHSSGIPTIQDELERNGSLRAEFFTDEDRRAMRIRIPIHSAFLEKNTNNLGIENETSFETSRL